MANAGVGRSRRRSATVTAECQVWPHVSNFPRLRLNVQQNVGARDRQTCAQDRPGQDLCRRATAWSSAALLRAQHCNIPWSFQHRATAFKYLGRCRECNSGHSTAITRVSVRCCWSRMQVCNDLRGDHCGPSRRADPPSPVWFWPSWEWPWCWHRRQQSAWAWARSGAADSCEACEFKKQVSNSLTRNLGPACYTRHSRHLAASPRYGVIGCACSSSTGSDCEGVWRAGRSWQA